MIHVAAKVPSLERLLIGYQDEIRSTLLGTQGRQQVEAIGDSFKLDEQYGWIYNRWSGELHREVKSGGRPPARPLEVSQTYLKREFPCEQGQ